jgi:hypothetical protein
MKPVEEATGSVTLLDHLRQGGFTAAVIGMAGMVAKILLSNDETMTWGKAARHVLAAGIVAWLVSQGLKEVSMAEGLKTACLGVSGAAATHVVDFAIEWVKAKGRAEVAKVKKGATRGKRAKR